MLARALLTLTTSLLLAQTQAYNAKDPLSPDFVLRSGYSRGNDDIEEGLFETAVFDNELQIRRRGDRWNFRLKYVANMVSLLSHAREEASGYTARNLGVYTWKTDKWERISREETSAAAFNFSTPVWMEASYLFDLKFREEAKREKANRIVVAERSIDLGTYEPGKYSGRVYLQSPTQPRTSQPYAHSSPSDYRVRHIIEWRVNITDRAIVSVKTPKILGDKKLHFDNEIRLIRPDWHGTVVSENGRLVRKEHIAPLMWKDIVYKDAQPEGPRYVRVNQLKIQSEHPENDEQIGRLPPDWSTRKPRAPAR